MRVKSEMDLVHIKNILSFPEGYEDIFEKHQGCAAGNFIFAGAGHENTRTENLCGR